MKVQNLRFRNEICWWLDLVCGFRTQIP